MLRRKNRCSSVVRKWWHWNISVCCKSLHFISLYFGCVPVFSLLISICCSSMGLVIVLHHGMGIYQQVIMDIMWWTQTVVVNIMQLSLFPTATVWIMFLYYSCWLYFNFMSSFMQLWTLLFQVQLIKRVLVQQLEQPNSPLQEEQEPTLLLQYYLYNYFCVLKLMLMYAPLVQWRRMGKSMGIYRFGSWRVFFCRSRQPRLHCSWCILNPSNIR